MPDAQNFSYLVLAVIFVKVEHLYFRRKLLTSSIEWYHFQLRIQTSIEKKMWRRSAYFALIWKIQYLDEDYSKGQTVVYLSSTCTKENFRKGIYTSWIAIISHSDILVHGSIWLCWHLSWHVIFGRFLQPGGHSASAQVTFVCCCLAFFLYTAFIK